MEHLSKNKVKLIRSLRSKKTRDAEGLFIVEGEKMVLELIHNHPDKIVLICSTKFDDIFRPTYHIDESEMKNISALTSSSEILAIVRKMDNSSSSESKFILALDGIQDPGNFGTIIRTAEWFGVDGIICSQDTVDCYNPKVIQGTMGSIFRMNIEYVNLSTYLAQSDLAIYGASLKGESLYRTAINRSAIIVIGNEGNGISDEVLPYINHPILIPNYGGAESLNASIATGIILAEFRR